MDIVVSSSSLRCFLCTDSDEIMYKRGISQKKAATDLHISQALLSHYEKGIRECGLDFVVAAADYYGWTVIQCVRDGAMRSIEDIHAEIYSHVSKLLEG